MNVIFKTHLHLTLLELDQIISNDFPYLSEHFRMNIFCQVVILNLFDDCADDTIMLFYKHPLLGIKPNKGAMNLNHNFYTII